MASTSPESITVAFCGIVSSLSQLVLSFVPTVSNVLHLFSYEPNYRKYSLFAYAVMVKPGS